MKIRSAYLMLKLARDCQSCAQYSFEHMLSIIRFCDTVGDNVGVCLRKQKFQLTVIVLVSAHYYEAALKYT